MLQNSPAAQSCLDERRVLHRRRVERVPLLQAGRRVPPAGMVDDRCHGFVDDRIVVLVHLQVIKVILQLDVARLLGVLFWFFEIFWSIVVGVFVLACKWGRR